MEILLALVIVAQMMVIGILMDPKESTKYDDNNKN